METIVLSLVGATAATLTMFGFVPQALKMWRTKSVGDVSFPTLVQIAVGVSFWVAYGIGISDPFVIAANAVTLTSLAVCIGFYLRYRHRKNRRISTN